MKLLRFDVTNFGSYRSFSLNLLELGLTLVSGPTGSGKSTLQDMPLWILFGETAKGGNVDEVRSWQSPNEPTTGILSLEHNGHSIMVTRIRGKASENDLYWQEDLEEEKHRGQNLSETQDLLEARLGVSAELYAAAAYYNEFSPTGVFFTSKAKDRRELFEKIASLELPGKITTGAINAKKETKKNLSERETSYAKLHGKHENLQSIRRDTARRRDSWAMEQLQRIQEIQYRFDNFDKEKAQKIEALTLQAERFDDQKRLNITKHELARDKKLRSFVTSRSCPTCGTLRVSDENDLLELNLHYDHLIEAENNARNLRKAELEALVESSNPYNNQLNDEKAKINPFNRQLEDLTVDDETTKIQLMSLQREIDELKTKLSTLSQLQDLASNLRGVLLIRAVKDIESQTNKYLEKYFDSEIRVAFETSGSDSLDVTIHKSGYEASYRQLSKGQRCLLKLCFSLSVMKAASNKIGTDFNVIMLDEALDGLDANLKIKAFSLLCQLEKEHETILVIDHAEELKSLFTRRFEVRLDSDTSVLENI